MPLSTHSEILDQIRAEIATTRTELKAELVGTNERIDGTNQRLDVTNQRLDVTIEELSTIDTVVREAAQQIAIDDLRERVSKLEDKVG